VLDTSVSLKADEKRVFEGNEYWGRLYMEHQPDASQRERLDKLRASLDNPVSFWLTRPSLFNLLIDAGFTSVLETRSPRASTWPEDHVTLVAKRGSYQPVPGTPNPEDPAVRWPEREARVRDPQNTFRGRLTRAVRGVGR